jgi:hypothetical protein
MIFARLQAAPFDFKSARVTLANISGHRRLFTPNSIFQALILRFKRPAFACCGLAPRSLPEEI